MMLCFDWLMGLALVSLYASPHIQQCDWQLTNCRQLCGVWLCGPYFIMLMKVLNINEQPITRLKNKEVLCNVNSELSPLLALMVLEVSSFCQVPPFSGTFTCSLLSFKSRTVGFSNNLKCMSAPTERKQHHQGELKLLSHTLLYYSPVKLG